MRRNEKKTMLDLSIKELKKALTTQEKKAEFLRKRIVVSEKFDGTKLTLIRNNENFDASDYTKNWIVAYKGNVLFAEEYAGITGDRFYSAQRINEDVRWHSLGTSQYGYVHQRLSECHKRCESIPKNTEFLIEFIQDKPTLTRDYIDKHDMFLVGYAPTTYVVRGLRVFSVAEKLETHRITAYARMLGIREVPVVFDGPASELGTIDDIVAGYQKLKSCLKGDAEGVVIRTNLGELFKVVAPDQYNKEVRKAKKMRYALEEPLETAYWNAIKAQANQLIKDVIIDNHDSASASQLHRVYLRELSRRCYQMPRDYLDGKNHKKETIVIQDDLFLTCKLMLERELSIPSATKTFGVFVMSGKPVHRGHWMMIEKVAEQNDIAMVFVSSKSRGDEGETVSGAVMMKIWREMLLDRLPSNVVIRFSDNPNTDAINEVKTLRDERPHAIIAFYGDANDATTYRNDERLKGFGVVGVKRETLDLISGTKMRWMLKMGDEGHKLQFMMHLPSCMSLQDRERTWELLRKSL